MSAGHDEWMYALGELFWSLVAFWSVTKVEDFDFKIKKAQDGWVKVDLGLVSWKLREMFEVWEGGGGWVIFSFLFVSPNI